MLEKSLSIVVNVFMNSEDAIESMLFHESSRDKTSSHDTMLMTMLMTILRVIIDCSSLEHRLVLKSILFRVNLCSSESYK